MSDAQTIFEFRLACHKPGCPVCTLVKRAGARYIEGTFNESMLDPGIRKKLVESLGFCHNHTWLSINLKLSDALGHALLYLDLIKKVLSDLQRIEDTGGILLETPAICPVCQIEQATLERVMKSIVAALKEPDFVSEYTQSKGLCLPHLKLLLSDLDRKQQGTILSHQNACLEILKSELVEFIRKCDYRFRDEVIGMEGDAYKRAADIIWGKRGPIEKNDLG